MFTIKFMLLIPIPSPSNLKLGGDLVDDDDDDDIEVGDETCKA